VDRPVFILNTGATLVYLQISGIIPDRNDALNVNDSGKTIESEVILKIKVNFEIYKATTCI